MTRIQGLDGMREAEPLNVTALVEAARVASKPQAPPEPVWTGPREGSAAWQAEQIAMGKAEIKTRPVQLDFAQGTFAVGGPTTPGWSSAFREVWDGLRTVRWLLIVGLMAFGAYVYFTGGPPSAREVSEAFVEIPGYGYQTEEVPGLDQAESALSSLPGFDRDVSAVEARGVVRDGVLAGVALIAGLDPSETTDAKLSAQIERHLPGAHVVVLGSPGREVMAYEFTMGSATEVVFVDEDGFLVVVAGLNRSHVHNIASSIGVGNL
jgi:hypothetical protein